MSRNQLEKLSLKRQELEAAGIRGRDELAAAAWQQVYLINNNNNNNCNNNNGNGDNNSNSNDNDSRNDNNNDNNRTTTTSEI